VALRALILRLPMAVAAAHRAQRVALIMPKLVAMVEFTVVAAAVVLLAVFQLVALEPVAQFVSCGPVTPAHSHQLVQAHLNFLGETNEFVY